MNTDDPFKQAFGCFEDLDRRMIKVGDRIQRALDALEKDNFDDARSWLQDADDHLEAARREARETSNAVAAARDRAELAASDENT
jgi:hypothetical protein